MQRNTLDGKAPAFLFFTCRCADRFILLEQLCNKTSKNSASSSSSSAAAAAAASSSSSPHS
jgi:hypothetical protein